MKNTSDNITTFPDQESGQKVAKNLGGAVSTHGSLHKIKQRVTRDTARYFGRQSVSHYVIRLKQGSHRRYFALESDLDESAKKARLIKEHLRHGWESTVAKFAPNAREKISRVTIGQFLELVERHAQMLPFTFHTYARKLRQVAAGVAGIKLDGADKFGGTKQPSKWKLKVDAVLLEKITPGAVERWRGQYLAERVGPDWNRTEVEHTVNAIVRNARSLFAKRLLKTLLLCEPSLQLPTPLPFEGVDLLPESEADFFYFSEINAPATIRKAFTELKGELFVMFILAIGAGLRRKEIDNLCWSRVNFESGTVFVGPTATAKLKSDDSLGELELEPEFMAVLREHREKSGGDFVLRPERPARVVHTYSFYRCGSDFEKLSEWLQSQGMKQRHKIHGLRKEFGSGIAKEHGIHAASSSLRHSSIALTSRHYADRKSVPTSYFKKNAQERQQAGETTAVVNEMLRLLRESGYDIKKSA